MSNRPGARTWNEFFEFLHEVDGPVDFMSERQPQERGSFDDELLTVMTCRDTPDQEREGRFPLPRPFSRMREKGDL